MKTGQWVMTRGINSKMEKDKEFAKFVFESVRRYVYQDWGDTCKEDWKMNDDAVKHGDDRIVAKYNNSCGDIFIITEWDRSATTILLTEEY